MKNKKNKIIEAPVLSLSAKVERLALFLRAAANHNHKKPSRALRKQISHIKPVHSVQEAAKVLKRQVHTVIKKKKIA